jgi:hypothetical protein
MINPVRATARIVRDWGTSTQFSMMSRAANVFAVLTSEPRWWRCTEPGWWSVQTIWIDGRCEQNGLELLEARPLQVLVEVEDRPEPGVCAIEDWRPQPAAQPYSTQDRSFGHILPGHGPVQVLAHHAPPFGKWTPA